MIPFHSDLPFESRSYSILTQNLDHLLGIRQGCNVRKARNDAFGLRGTRIKNEWGPGCGAVRVDGGKPETQSGNRDHFGSGRA